MNRFKFGACLGVALALASPALLTAAPGPQDKKADGDSEKSDAGKFEPFKSESVRDRKSTRLNSSHQIISYAVFCLKKKTLAVFQPGNACPIVCSTPAPFSPPCELGCI